MNDKTAVRNIMSYIGAYLVKTILGFIVRRHFAAYLGQNVMGLNALMTSVISMLSLMEMGVGTAIGFSLYRPLQEGDENAIRGIMNIFRKVYTCVAILVLAIGLLITPVMFFLVDQSLPNHYVFRIYLLFLLDTASSYLISYRRVIIQSDKKAFVINNVDLIAFAAMSLGQLAVMQSKNGFEKYLLIKMACVVAANVYLWYRSGRDYPFLRKKQKIELDQKYKAEILKNVKALFVINIASYFVFGTDNLLLTGFGSLTATAIYSGYSMIVGVVNNVFNRVFSSITANLGHFLLMHTDQENYSLFQKLFFLNFVIETFVSAFMLVLFNDVITLWLGAEYIWEMPLVIIIVLNNYCRQMTQCSEAFRGAKGLYSPRKWVKYLALLEGITNIVFSVLLIKLTGLVEYGVFLGTTISTVAATVGVPYVVQRYLFNRDLREYFSKYIRYFISSFLCCGIALTLCCQVNIESSIVRVASKIFITGFVFAVCIGTVYFRNPEFRFWIKQFRSMLMKRGNRNDR
ncbi:hypothetical protein IMSAG185_01376 [Lachnospiraceae bacterium]|jgi:O-antigen/teichoic acid export membrane protein|nr:hypothetical protein IMSAG185_01376 [Lachnospiraceae bacterium]